MIDTESAPKTLQERMALPTYLNPNDLLLLPTRFKDGEGREWQLAQNVKEEWVKIRKYEYTPAECEASGAHEVRPTRWPVEPRFQAVGPIKMEIAGYESVRCERCGANVMVTNAMAEPGSGVKVVLPKPVKGAA